MSVLKTMVAVPPRIAAVFRYLLTVDEKKEKRDRLERMLAPQNLTTTPESKSMINEVINECKNMCLVTEAREKEDRVISLSEMSLTIHPESEFNPVKFRMLLNRLIMDTNNDKNHDLCKLISWFLAQDVFSFPGDHQSFTALLRDQFGDDRLGLTNQERFRQFRFWSVFLGFALALRNPTKKGEQLIPDPTKFLETNLPSILSAYHEEHISLIQLMSQLSKVCPAFEGGIFFDTIVKQLPRRETSSISSAMSQALLRLHERHFIELSHRSDTPDMLVLSVKGKSPNYTHVRLNTG